MRDSGAMTEEKAASLISIRRLSIGNRLLENVLFITFVVLLMQRYEGRVSTCVTLNSGSEKPSVQTYV